MIRLLHLFPLAFLADVYGFIFFVPYLMLVLGLTYVLRRRRRQRPALALVPVRS